MNATPLQLAIASPAFNHRDITEEVRARTKKRLWRVDPDAEMIGQRALEIAMRYGKNRKVIQSEIMERGYKMAEVTTRNGNWLGTNRSADADIRDALVLSRARGRDIEQNNPYGERYLSELESNVLGPEGMQLQMQVRVPTGEPDKNAIRIIEAAWEEWKRLGNCDVSGDLCFSEIEAMALRATARDGEVLIRKVKNFGNAFGFALQIIESDFLDHNFTQNLGNGNIVVMGVEMDQWRRRVAYHILTQHPGDFYFSGFGRGGNLTGMPASAMMNRVRISANDIIHLRMMRRPGQTRGVSWFAPVAEQMEMVRGYEEAELTSARAEACKGGFYYADIPLDGGIPGTVVDPQKAGLIKDIEPGMMEGLPPGVKFQAYDPKHPSGNYGEYRKGVLRGVASGLLVSYNVLANDLEGVNYSSLRGGLLDEREIYKRIQGWFISRFEIPIFGDWLEMAILSGKVALGISQLARWNAPWFQGRRWDWVDPLKDIQAIELAIESGLTSRRAECAKRSGDILDVAIEQKQDVELAAKFGLTWGRPEAIRGSLAPEIPGDGETAAVAKVALEKETETDATTEAVAQGSDTLQQSALNGAQIEAMLSVVDKVTTGAIGKASAAAILAAAFPLLAKDAIEKILESIEIKPPAET